MQPCVSNRLSAKETDEGHAPFFWHCRLPPDFVSKPQIRQKLNLHTISIVTKNGGFVNSKTGEFALSEQKCRPAFQTERHFAQ
ncbi:MAG: hypothetical protein ACLUHE_17545 [Christensenellales bacterium]